ncbi:MAG: chemotaxis protein CheB [Bacteroidota bacterium]|nr:chemotaxis protein CheB [Bacteroidota bacterium]
MDYKIIVIGTSAGGLDALKKLLPVFPPAFPVPIVIVQHLSSRSNGFMIQYLNSISSVRVKEAEEKELLAPATVYFAPPNYHLLIEDNQTLSLSVEKKVNYARPSIDVLFESAAYAFGKSIIGVILTGANHDGAKGLAQIKRAGGYTIVQSPETAYSGSMPKAAIAQTNPDRIISIDEIGIVLRDLFMKKPNRFI